MQTETQPNTETAQPPVTRRVDPNEIGALWQKTSRTGHPFYTGFVNIDGKRTQIILYDVESENPAAPKYRIKIDNYGKQLAANATNSNDATASAPVVAPTPVATNRKSSKVSPPQDNNVPENDDIPM